jgi:hypothetical protein
MFTETRHKIEFGILLILAFIAFCTPAYWIQWTFLASIAFIFLLVGKKLKLAIMFQYFRFDVLQ